MKTLRPAIYFVVYLSFSIQSSTIAEETSKFAHVVKKQACGPCSVLNSLLLGLPDHRAVVDRIEGSDLSKKVTTLIEDYGEKPSETHGKESMRYRPTGVAPNDLLHFFNDLNRDYDLPKVQGEFLNRDDDESLRDHLTEIHALLQNSIDSGTPVVAFFRSFAAKPGAEKGQYSWKGLKGHFVTIVEVQSKIENNEMGFRFCFADSSSGQYEYGYFYIDRARNFSAAKGGEWLKNRPFLLVTAPTLRMKTETTNTDWHYRTIITFNHAIYRLKSSKPK